MPFSIKVMTMVDWEWFGKRTGGIFKIRSAREISIVFERIVNSSPRARRPLPGEHSSKAVVGSARSFWRYSADIETGARKNEVLNLAES